MFDVVVISVFRSTIVAISHLWIRSNERSDACPHERVCMSARLFRARRADLSQSRQVYGFRGD